MSEPVRVLIVDDEPLARRRLRRLLAEHREVEIAGEADNGRTAVTAIQELRPELVFLDVQMPDLDGFGVLTEIGLANLPAVIFVTAFDRYAVDAFEVEALDYVLKPFTRERLTKALDRALERRREKSTGALRERLERLLASHEEVQETGKGSAPSRFAVRRAGRIFFVARTDVDWIEADGAYVRLHTGQGTHLLRDSLKRLEGVLDPGEFARIHRSVMVRVDRVAQLRPLDHGEYEITLDNGVRLKLSRSYREALERLTGG